MTTGVTAEALDVTGVTGSIEEPIVNDFETREAGKAPGAGFRHRKRLNRKTLANSQRETRPSINRLGGRLNRSIFSGDFGIISPSFYD